MGPDNVIPSGPRVLVIEDDRDVLALLASQLRRLGCEVLSADSGELGLQVAWAELPDVILVDLILPGIHGREVIEAIRHDERTSACRVIVTSILDEKDCGDVRVDAVLPKPFTRRDVARVLTTLDQPVV